MPGKREPDLALDALQVHIVESPGQVMGHQTEERRRRYRHRFPRSPSTPSARCSARERERGLAPAAGAPGLDAAGAGELPSVAARPASGPEAERRAGQAGAAAYRGSTPRCLAAQAQDVPAAATDSPTIRRGSQKETVTVELRTRLFSEVRAWRGSVPHSFRSSDCWVFLATAFVGDGVPVRLSEVIGMADAINHAILTTEGTHAVVRGFQ